MKSGNTSRRKIKFHNLSKNDSGSVFLGGTSVGLGGYRSIPISPRESASRQHEAGTRTLQVTPTKLTRKMINIDSGEMLQTVDAAGFATVDATGLVGDTIDSRN